LEPNKLVRGKAVFRGIFGGIRQINLQIAASGKEANFVICRGVLFADRAGFEAY
jgi:hypothetical protein